MYEKINSVLSKLNLHIYDILYVSSAGFANYWEPNFDLLIISALKNIMEEKTIIMPSFSFDFCDNGIYSVNHSKNYCGSISEVFRKQKDVERTLYSPVHNVCVWGKLQNYFINKIYSSSFGEDSIFQDMTNFKCGILMIDCSFDDGVPFVHCLENKYNSNYRMLKIFQGKIIKKDGVSFDYDYPRLIRKPNVKLSAEKIGKDFYSTDAVKQIKYEKSIFTTFALSSFYDYFEPIFERNPKIMEVEYED